MYSKYCGIAFAVTALIYVIVYLYMKNKNLVNRENIINLTGCTVLAMFCSAMTPYLARQLAHKLYFSVLASIFVSWIILAVFIGSVFLIIKEYIESKGRSKVSQDAGQLEAVKEEAQNHSEINIEQESQGTSWIEIIASQDAEHNTEYIAGHNEIHELLTEAELVNTADNVETFEEVKVNEEAKVDEVPEPNETYENYEVYNAYEAYEAYEVYEALEQAATSVVTETYDEPTLENLVESALDYKDKKDYQGAISMYEKAIDKISDNQLLELVIIDLCSLYKLTNQKYLAVKTLEKIDKNLLNPEIIDILQQNL
ncbi:MAG: hypothetical protein GXX10_06460 [Clostridiaceae bacterium]|nr:hypothetical protein [Clostridiaceae bacterium]